MMDIDPISETEIWDMINASEARMSFQQRKFWDVIRIQPERWVEKSYGEATGGFWAVGVIGNFVVWYNEIEEGFNRSNYEKYGTIKDYFCNQDNLEWTIQHLMNLIKDGTESSGFASPPIPLN